MLFACAHRPPTVPSPPVFRPVTPQVLELSSGIPVWLVSRPELPLLSLRLVIAGGSTVDPPAHPGLTGLADTMLLYGAGERDATAYAAEVERLALEIDAQTAGTATIVSLDAHADRLDAGLDLFADAVLRPRFDTDAVDRVRALRQGSITQDLDDPAVVAVWVADRMYFGVHHPKAHPAVGTVDGIAEIDPQALHDSWAHRAGPRNAAFVVTGAIDADTLVAALESRFGDWTSPARHLGPVPDTPRPTDGPQLIFVDNPGASQSVLRVVQPGPSAHDPELTATRLGIIALGGTFTSRLNRLLREEKGYTYGARSYLVAGKHAGRIVTNAAVKGDVTAAALTDMLGELDTIRAGIDDDERTKALGARRTGLIGGMETRSGVADLFSSLVLQGRAPTALANALTVAEQTTTADIEAALGKRTVAQGVVVVVGDLSKIRESVEAAVPGTWTVVEKQ